jgi:hypothetical protein
MQKCNVDPLFNNAVDGLMYIRIADIPERNQLWRICRQKKISWQRRLRQIYIVFRIWISNKKYRYVDTFYLKLI